MNCAGIVNLGHPAPALVVNPGEEPIRPVGRPERPTACAHSMMTITIRFTSTPMGVVEGSTVGFLHHEDGHRVAHFLYENPDLYQRAACRARVAGWMGSRREGCWDVRGSPSSCQTPLSSRTEFWPGPSPAIFSASRLSADADAGGEIAEPGQIPGV